MNKKSRFLWVMLLLLLAACTTGCGRIGKGTTLVFTRDLEKEEVFRINGISCYLPELKVYLAGARQQYEDTFGTEVWEADMQGVSLESSIKDNVLAKVSRVKALNLMADSYSVELDEEEENLAKQAGLAYWNGLSQEEKDWLELIEEDADALLIQMAREYALAGKVYQYIIRDINPEISDDEARTITVEHILIKTYSLDENGNKIEYSREEKEAALERAQEALARVQDGEDFETLAAEYNEDDKSIYSFGMGDMEPAYETAAFALGSEEISDVVESEYGYIIIKCLNTFNREETDLNKEKIVAQRRREAFGREYESFTEALIVRSQEELWDKAQIYEGPEQGVGSFFDDFEEAFGDRYLD